MSSYLVYHPRRVRSVARGIVVYHDQFGGNEDPFLWNECFLHTYCHITEMRIEAGDMTFWVSGDRFPNFEHLFCDLVFAVTEKHFWSERNSIARDDPLIDSEAAFAGHYCWAGRQHPFTRRRRYTLKADTAQSYQPQDGTGSLIDILPVLVRLGLSLSTLRSRLVAARGSRPMSISDDLARRLCDRLADLAPTKLRGADIAPLRSVVLSNSKTVIGQFSELHQIPACRDC
jgi:hypothetical protein